MTDEDLCLQCGRCCRKKFVSGGDIVFSDVACDHLDPETKLCTVYENRFIVYGGCLNVKQTMERGFLPEDCPYVKDIPGYVGPREATPQELEDYHRRSER